MPEYNEGYLYRDPNSQTFSGIDNGSLTYVNYTFEQIMTMYSLDLLTWDETRRWLHISNPKKGENIEVNNDSR